ncbi:cpr-6 [Symbiodinium sp. CCMP2592]|nr:cpr-6 [Symbiodinium sp. CCMP2592]
MPGSRRSLFANTCIATVGGACCGRDAWAANVPYCEEHAGHGDPSCMVREIPRVGKILVAARPLPKGYRLAWWGRCCRKAEAKDLSRCFELSHRPGWVIDPTDHPGSLLQYCAAPGPSEASTLACTTKIHTAGGAGFGCWFFQTRHCVAKGEQLLMPYNKRFFEERGLQRVNVGTSEYPARPRRGHEAKAGSTHVDDQGPPDESSPVMPEPQEPAQAPGHGRPSVALLKRKARHQPGFADEDDEGATGGCHCGGEESQSPAKRGFRDGWSEQKDALRVGRFQDFSKHLPVIQS